MVLLAEIMRLRRACCHPRLALPDSPLPSSKLDAFADIVDELLENRHKALVFSQFVDHLKLIRDTSTPRHPLPIPRRLHPGAPTNAAPRSPPSRPATATCS
jgi:SNF2 family DNA or RNA helicase